MNIFPGLYIIIVSWNLKNDLLACIDSVLISGAQPQQIIVIDNASTDGTIEALRSRFGATIHILTAKENLGFAAGNNWGIRYALKQGAEWILLLNNDTIISRSMLQTLRKTVEQYPKYHIIAPLILYFDAPDTIWSAGDRLIPGTLITYHLYKQQQLTENLPSILNVDFVTGCGMLVNRIVFAEVGLLDESTFMYAEEIDFIWRARRAGHKTICATQAHMWHKISLSAQRDRPQARYLRIRNQIWFYRKYARRLQLVIMFLFVTFRLLGVGIADIITRRTELIRPLISGWNDGWFSDPT